MPESTVIIQSNGEYTLNSSVVGVFCKQLSSILFGIGFSLSEYVLNKLLEWIDINKKQSFIIQGDNV